MITIKDFMETVEYRITEGDSYGWQCFGSDSYRLDSWNGDHDGHSVSMVFDTRTQTVYQMSAYDYANERAYRWTNPDFRSAHDAEAGSRGVDGDQAWDDVNYVDLDVAEDMLEKARAIVAGEEYDTRVQVPVEFTDQEMLSYMKLAHELDITFNELVERALRAAIEAHEEDDFTTDRPQVWLSADEVAWPFADKPKKHKKKKKDK